MTDKAEVLFGENREKSTARTEAPTLTAGRTLDALIAEKVFGARWEFVSVGNVVARLVAPLPMDWILASQYGDGTVIHAARSEVLPYYSTDIAAAWQVVEQVQKQHPGWRFSLLGGDERWGYRRRGEDDDRYVVVKSVSSSFGWSAEFFGEQDPTIDYGARHGEAHHIETPALAICLAALKSVSVLSQTEEGK